MSLESLSIIAIILLALELIYFKLADRFNIIDKPNQRSSHSTITLRGGGIIFLIGIWIYSLFFGFTYPYFLVGLTLIAGISFVDDVRGVSNKVRLIVQFLAMFLMFQQFGILNIESWWIIILALILCVGIINAYNFMDGINGITGGYSLVVLLPLYYVNTKIAFIDPNYLAVSIISVVIFNIFNFRTKAKCFAGDVGAIGIAFIIIFALGRLILATGNFTYIMFLAIYGIDTFLTIIHRIKLKENIGEAHRKHTYQIMANELKLPHVVVSLTFMTIQLILSFGLLLLPINNWIYSLIILVILIILYILFRKRYYYLHEQYIKSQR